MLWSDFRKPETVCCENRMSPLKAEIPKRTALSVVIVPTGFGASALIRS